VNGSLSSCKNNYVMLPHLISSSLSKLAKYLRFSCNTAILILARPMQMTARYTPPKSPTSVLRKLFHTTLSFFSLLLDSGYTSSGTHVDVFWISCTIYLVLPALRSLLLISLTHAQKRVQETCTSWLTKLARLTCFLTQIFLVLGPSFLHAVERRSFPRKFVQELTKTCIKIWRKSLYKSTCFLSVCRRYHDIVTWWIYSPNKSSDRLDLSSDICVGTSEFTAATKKTRNPREGRTLSNQLRCVRSAR